MKNKLYYILFVLYIIMTAFILYINGVFDGTMTSLSSLLVNALFLLVIGILFLRAAVNFSRLNRCTEALTDAAAQMDREYSDRRGCVWNEYENKKSVFENMVLDDAFTRYQRRMKQTTGKGTISCDLEEYINEDLIDRAGGSHFNAAMPGALTGLGILGTFVGLSFGLGAFNGNDIYTISDNVGPLLNGMKVAFHTSVYGIFFSLVFSFIYRGIMADAYEKLSRFLTVFRECVMPAPRQADGNSSAMLIYQANMANTLKSMLELQKGNAEEQTKAVEVLVNQFTERMNQTLGADFERLGMRLRRSCDLQQLSTDNCKSMEEVAGALLESNRLMQEALKQTIDRQEEFSEALEAQRTKLSTTCDKLSEEISNQLYTFNQMRDSYEE